MDYVPNREKERREMLEAIGASSIAELFASFTPKLDRPLRLPEPLPEMELKRLLQSLSEKNARFKSMFRGAGAYAHYQPAAVNQLLLRSEFYTAYTPYQPEVSQGTLTAIYEFQTYVCRLTGMDAANASMYDAGSALAETAIMSFAFNERKEVVCLETVHPHYAEVVKTYCKANGMHVKRRLEDVGAQTACVMVQYPNFFGEIEELKEIGEKTHAAGALFVVCVGDATSLALLAPPGELGADIVVGDVQAFGLPVSYGGPFAGFMAVKKEHIRRMPGRLAGMTVDNRGNQGFVLTLQAREQHIRREKATSNLCTNQALMALAATMYLGFMGKTGLRAAATQSYEKAHKVLEELEALGFARVGTLPFYNEFRVRCPVDVKELNGRLLEKGVLGGLQLPNNEWLVCCTELNSEKDLETIVNTVQEMMGS